jgi:hypothetical protein
MVYGLAFFSCAGYFGHQLGFVILDSSPKCNFESSLLLQGDCFGQEHTCPGGRCQGERPRKDMFMLMNEIAYPFN